LDKMLYYRGVGSAKLAFFIESAATHVVTPSNHAEEGFKGGRTVIDVSSKDIQLGLKNRVGFASADVRVNNGLWTIADKKGIKLDVSASVPTGELVNFDVQLGGGTIGGSNYSTVCSPHVNINSGNYVLHAIADLTLSDSRGRFQVHDITMTPPFD